MSNNIGTYFVITSIVIVLFTMLGLTSQEIQDKNPNLDQASIDALNNINTNLDENFEAQSMLVSTDNLTENSSFEGTDAFQREFLESKSEAESQRSVFGKVLGVPDLILISLGIQNDNIIIMVKTILVSLIVFFLGLAIYKAWKTGEVDG